MFPIALDLKKISILLIGKGEALERRHKQLLEYGATNISICHTSEGWYLDPKNMDASLRWHDNNIIMVCGLSREQSKQISDAARAAGKLVNVEDINELCDFYFTANIKRGDLVISVSTGGASPTLSRRIRDYIAGKFGAEWAGHTKEIAEFRNGLKKQGKTIPQVLEDSDIFLQEKGWLK
ncbi:MAG: NAD(P)-dependent oxidoreductase [Rickettsiales bacterium]